MITLVLYIGSLPDLATRFPCGRGRTLFILGSLALYRLIIYIDGRILWCTHFLFSVRRGGTHFRWIHFVSSITNKMRTFTFSAISEDIPISITTIYFGGLMGLFLTTGLLHLPEFYCLFQGVWFLLCLPSGYIMLIIYSICNITDRSWGKI